MGVDVQAMQGAWASAAMILTMLDRNKSVPALEVLMGFQNVSQIIT